MRVWYIADRWSGYLICAYVDQASEGRANVEAISFSAEDPYRKKIDDPPIPVEVEQTIYDLFCPSATPSVRDFRQDNTAQYEHLPCFQLPYSMTVDRGSIPTAPDPRFH
jgi:hypothetical protein